MRSADRPSGKVRRAGGGRVRRSTERDRPVAFQGQAWSQERAQRRSDCSRGGKAPWPRCSTCTRLGRDRSAREGCRLGTGKAGLTEAVLVPACSGRNRRVALAVQTALCGSACSLIQGYWSKIPRPMDWSRTPRSMGCRRHIGKNAGKTVGARGPSGSRWRSHGPPASRWRPDVPSSVASSTPDLGYTRFGTNRRVVRKAPPVILRLSVTASNCV